MEFRIIDDAYSPDDVVTVDTLKDALVMFFDVAPDIADEIVSVRPDGLYVDDVCVAVPNEWRGEP